MEEGALAATAFLVRLIIPISVFAAVLGIITIVKSLGGIGGQLPEPKATGQEPVNSGRAGSFLLERVATGLCGAAAVVLLLVLAMNLGRKGLPVSPWTFGLMMLILLLSAPAILWNTRYRVAGEGIATVAIAGIAILTGLSIGFVFVPLVVLMIWLCINQLRQSERHLKSDPPSG